jgi:hypothetical protein
MNRQLQEETRGTFEKDSGGTGGLQYRGNEGMNRQLQEMNIITGN